MVSADKYHDIATIVIVLREIQDENLGGSLRETVKRYSVNGIGKIVAQ